MTAEKYLLTVYPWMKMKDWLKNLMGIVLDENLYEPGLSAEENAKFFGKYFEHYDHDIFLRYCRRFHVDTKKKIKKLSKGQQMKFQIAFALSHEAKLFIMDEPTTNLDQAFRLEFTEIMQDLVSDGEKSINVFITSPTVPLLYYIYLNNLVFSRSAQGAVIGIYFYIVIISLTFFPIRLAKGMYLCPLTKDDRKKYIMAACYIRFVMLMLLYGLVLIVSGIFLDVSYMNLLLQFISGGLIIFFLVISSIDIFGDPMEMARRRYYAKQKIPYPQKSVTNKVNNKPGYGCAIIIGIVVLSGVIGVMILMNKTEFKPYYLFYHIPSYIVSLICVIIFYKKYMDQIITASANREVFTAKKMKAGVFHAD